MSVVRVLQKLLTPDRAWIKENRQPEDNFFQYMRELDAQVRAPVTRSYTAVTVANLPTDATPGTTAFASNGRKPGEGVGSGTGVPVTWDGTAWRSPAGTTVAA